MSNIGDEFDAYAMPTMKDHLGDAMVYLSVDGTTTYTVTAVFNEFVGAVDDKGRAIITVSSQPAPVGIPTPRRGDRLAMTDDDGTTSYWWVIDIRSSRAGEHELRCDTALGDV